MMGELQPKVDAAKRLVLAKGEKYYYVFFIGTRKDCQGRGEFQLESS